MSHQMQRQTGLIRIWASCLTVKDGIAVIVEVVVFMNFRRVVLERR